MHECLAVVAIVHLLLVTYAMLALTKAGFFGAGGQQALEGVTLLQDMTLTEPQHPSLHAYRRCPFPMWGMLWGQVAAIVLCHLLPMLISAVTLRLIVPHLQYPLLGMHGVLCIIGTAAVFSYRGCLLTAGPVYNSLWLISLFYLLFLPFSVGAFQRAYEIARKYEKQRRHFIRREKARGMRGGEAAHLLKGQDSDDDDASVDGGAPRSRASESTKPGPARVNA
jgi:hypothetical protein